MITSTMTADDIRRIRQEDDERLKRFIIRKQKVLRKLLKHGIKKVSCCYDYKTRNAEYKVVVVVVKKNGTRYSIYAHEREQNVFIDVTHKQYRFPVFTPHFFKRVAERYYKKEMPLNKVMAVWSVEALVPIYQNGSRQVCATEKGVFLGLYLEDFDVFKTYLSMDLLKETQYNAYEKVEGLIQWYKDEIELYGASENSFDLVMDDILESIGEYSKIISLAQEEYEKYFKSYEDD